MGILLKISEKVHVHQCCKCGNIEQCTLGKFCDGPAKNDFCMACGEKQIADQLPCPKCGGSEGYALKREVEERNGARHEVIALVCNVCEHRFEVENQCHGLLN
jgi:hypothetical protein